jgi:hypothetical protein
VNDPSALPSGGSFIGKLRLYSGISPRRLGSSAFDKIRPSS